MNSKHDIKTLKHDVKTIKRYDDMNTLKLKKKANDDVKTHVVYREEVALGLGFT